MTTEPAAKACPPYPDVGRSVVAQVAYASAARAWPPYPHSAVPYRLTSIRPGNGFFQTYGQSSAAR